MLDFDKIAVLIIFIACYALALSRKVKIAYTSIISSVLLIGLGLVSVNDVLSKAIKWNVLMIYWGFLMVSYVFLKSGMPNLVANKILEKVKVEKYAILTLCAFTASLSAFMENVGVVFIMAPIAIEIARKLNSSLFPYIVGVAISSNATTTVTMIADPPALILAMETGMSFLDFYWFQNKIGLGVISIFGVATALLVLLFQFRNMNKKVDIRGERVTVSPWATLLFIAGIFGLATCQKFEMQPGVIGLMVGVSALILEYLMKGNVRRMLVTFDWNSFLFIAGIFIVIFSVNHVGLLKDFVNLIVGAGLIDPTAVLAFVTWISVGFSAFMDNVPYTVLMIPVCKYLAEFVGTNMFTFLYGMIVGTGIGGNITPVGATANIFACGILEKHGYKVKLFEYMKIGLPFSITAVLTAHITIQLIWL